MALRENIHMAVVLAVLCIGCTSQGGFEMPLDAILCIGRTDSKV